MPATPFQCRVYRERLRERVRKIYGTKCHRCGRRRKLQLAHIKPTKLNGMGRGLTNRLLDAIYHRHAYAALCWYCHILFDRGAVVVERCGWLQVRFVDICDSET